MVISEKTPAQIIAGLTSSQILSFPRNRPHSPATADQDERNQETGKHFDQDRSTESQWGENQPYPFSILVQAMTPNRDNTAKVNDGNLPLLKRSVADKREAG